MEGYKNVCFNCLEECDFAKEDESYIRNYKSFLPRCASCKAMGKESFSRKSKIANVKGKKSHSEKPNIDMNKNKNKVVISPKRATLEPKQSHSDKPTIPKEGNLDIHKTKSKNKSSAGPRAGNKRQFVKFSNPLTNGYYLCSTTSTRRGNTRFEISKYEII